MAVTIKSAREIELMREAGRILAEVHEELGALSAPEFPRWTLICWAKN